MKIGKIIRTKFFINFCSGCNNQVTLQKFIAVDEAEEFSKAMERRRENADDDLFCRTRFMAFCICGNVFIGKK